MREKRSFLLQSTKQLNGGAMVCGAGFLAYILLAALGLVRLADALALVFGAASAYVFVCVALARRRDKEAVSYNLLWGQLALTLLLGGCAVLTLRELLGG